MRNMNKKGFTIVELVIVIAVIAILAAVLIPTFSGVVAKANESAANQTATNALKAGLLMSSTASLPDGTMVLVDSNKDGSYEYAYKYDGNKLSDPIDAKPEDFKKTVKVNNEDKLVEFNKLMVNEKYYKDNTLDTTAQGILKQAFGWNAEDITNVSFSFNSEKNTIDALVKTTTNTEGTTYSFSVFTSPDIPASGFIILYL